MAPVYTVSKVQARTLRATVHYACEGKTVCGRTVGPLRLRWFVRFPWEAPLPVNCPRCLAWHARELAAQQQRGPA